MMSYITSTLSRLSLKARQIQRLAAQCHTRKSPKRRVGNGSSTQESNLDKAGLFHAGQGRRYIAQDSLTAAQHLLESAFDTAESLSLFSERGRVPALQQPNVRELLVQRYRPIYEVFDTKVEVLAFIHGASDFAKCRLSITGEAGSQAAEADR